MKQRGAVVGVATLACALLAGIATASSRNVGQTMTDSMAAFKKGDYAAAAAILEVLPPKLKPEDRARLRGFLGVVHRSWAGQLREHEQFQEAARHAGIALELARETNNRGLEAMALLELGTARNRLRQHRLAAETFQDSRAAFREVANAPMEELALELSAGALGSAGEHRAAAESYREALAMNERLVDREGQARVLVGLSGALDSLSEYGAAITAAERALSIARDIKSAGWELQALHRLGASYSWLNDDDKAVANYEKALAIARGTKNELWESSLLADIAEIQQDHGELDKALHAFMRSLDLASKARLPRLETYRLVNVGSVYRDRNEPATSRKYLEQAVALARRHDLRFEEGFALYHLALLAEQTGAREEARRYFSQVLSVATMEGMAHGQGHALAGLMRVARAAGEQQGAVFLGKQAVNAFQSVRGEISGLPEEVRRAYAGSLEDQYRILASLLIDEQRLPEAQQVVRLLKEEEHFNVTRRSGTQRGEASAAELTPREAEWEARYREIEGEIVKRSRELEALKSKAPGPEASADRERRAELERDKRTAEKAFQAFLALLKAEAERTSREARIEQIKESKSLMEVWRALGPDVVAVYTVVTPDRLRLILQTPLTQRGYDSPVSGSQLAERIWTFRELIEKRRPESELLPVAQELYRSIVQPLANDLQAAGARTIMWSLDGSLRYLPLAALHDGKGYFVQRYRNVMFTLASHANLKDAPLPRWTALGLGVSAEHTGFDALPNVVDELKAVIREDPKSSSGVLPGIVKLNAQFTRQAMDEELSRRPAVVHLASHFVFRPGSTEKSYFLLGDGNHLSLAEIDSRFGMFGGADLLTLSACDTAVGAATAEGKEVESFAVIAQQQGAKAVVATLWPVEDSSTRTLMEAFYRGHETKGTTKVDALQRAQRSLMSQPRYAHPYFWAPFILIGNWR